jgi:hypothetical protein
MISTRVGAAVAILLALAALALAIVAFMANVRDDGPTPGRLVQTRLTNEYDGPPQAFVVDDFFIDRGSDGRLHAWYAYPPGFFGHSRGCKIIWDPTATIDTARGVAGPGLFVDPCGGARFNADGELVIGPADRNLDEFATSAAVDGTLVDTRKLLCGSPLPSDATPTASATATPTALPATCERVSPDTK